MIIRPLDTQALRRQFDSAVPFPHVMIEEFLDRDFALEVARAVPPYSESQAYGANPFETVNEHRKVQFTDREQMAPPIQELIDELYSEDFRKKLGEITGVDGLLADERLLGGGIQQTASGGFLDVHLDFNYLPDVELFRRCNLLVYLNPEWEEEWGGDLELWNEDVTERHGTVPPKLNHCVIFETSTFSWHGVTRVRSPEHITRKHLLLNYYAPQPAEHWNGQFFGTVFHARPDEKVKGNVLMPVERAWHKMRWTISKIWRKDRRQGS